jgi:hypothetical protein
MTPAFQWDGVGTIGLGAPHTPAAVSGSTRIENNFVLQNNGLTKWFYITFD